MDLDRLLYLIFAIPCGLIELYISTKNFSSTVDKSSSKDRGSFAYIWLIIAGSQAFAVYCIRQGLGMKIIDDGPVKSYCWIPASVLLYLLGHGLRRQAINQLGTWFTTIVRTNAKQQLIDSGWYARMRHPSYTGVLMYFLGLTLLLNNWLGVVGIILPVTFVFLYRIHIEEQALEKHFGEKYREYRTKVPNKIFPKLV